MGARYIELYPSKGKDVPTLVAMAQKRLAESPSDEYCLREGMVANDVAAVSVQPRRQQGRLGTKELQERMSTRIWRKVVTGGTSECVPSGRVADAAADALVTEEAREMTLGM